jgi:SAM-dependent methyltransferase
VSGAEQVRSLQTKAFEELWRRTIWLSRLSYNSASPLRILKFAYRTCRQSREDVRVLEVGFGRGDGLFWFRPSCSLHGLELSDTAIGRANSIGRKRGYASLDFRKPTSEGMSYPCGFFDVIVLSHVLEHFHDHLFVLREVARCLRPQGGRAYLIVPLDDWQERRLSEEEMAVQEFWTGESVHVRRYNMLTLESIVREAGLEVLHALAMDHVMDWKDNLEQKFRKRLRAKLRFVDRFILSPVINIPLSILSFPLWKALDDRMKSRGWRPRQALIVARKAG